VRENTSVVAVTLEMLQQCGKNLSTVWMLAGIQCTHRDLVGYVWKFHELMSTLQQIPSLYLSFGETY
jgi:hypothetical protein